MPLASSFSPFTLFTLFCALVVGCSSPSNGAPVEDELRRDASSGAAADAGTDARSTGDGASEVAAPDAGANTFVDPRDGQIYPTLELGAKTWLARNLNFEIAGSSYCYDDDPSHCARDGRLYPWSVARTACAPGWHLGSDAEWKSLESAVGMAADQLDLEGYSTLRGTDEGSKLKSAAGFGATTMAGFRAGGTYEARDDRTYFWTSSSRGGDVWRRKVSLAEATVFRFTNPPSTFAISVRCVMD